MGADYILHRTCDPKAQLGGGDPLAGTERMLAMLKARTRAQAVYRLMEREGRDPATASIKVMVVTAQGPEEREVSVAQMMAEAAPLDDLASHCAGCDACALGDTFGCVGFLRYPLTDPLERWIVERVQPADTLGGFLLLRAIDDFGYRGEPMAGWRQRRELLERPTALEATVAKRFLSATRVSVDQILQAILAVGGQLEPAHCMGVLLWLGALRIHGRVPGPGSANDPAPLVALTQASSAAERRSIAQLDVGAPHEDPCICGFQQLLFAMYAAWVIDTPLLMDS
jgi:hypothetical protein